MKSFFLPFVFILFVIIGVSCEKDEALPVIDNPQINNDKTINNYSLQSISGNTVNLSDYVGKVTVIYFFGNSCSTCKAQAPDIQKHLADAYADRDDYVIFGIDQWDGSLAAVQSFKTSTGVQFDLLLNGSSVAAAFETTYDRLLIIDKDGSVSFKGIRNAGTDIANAVSVINSLLE
jgi:peroxiredoxin